MNIYVNDHQLSMISGFVSEEFYTPQKSQGNAFFSCSIARIHANQISNNRKIDTLALTGHL